MTRWPMREASRTATAEPRLGDKVHRATLHTVRAREALVCEIPEWEQWREQARRIRSRALDRREALCQRFEAELARRGIHVHHAGSIAEAQATITELVTDVGHRVTKSKSMTSEEVQLNEALERAGVTVTETDLGELIVQLAGERPSHVTAPAIHLSIEDIAALFAKHLGMALPAWVEAREQVSDAVRRASARELALWARAHLRERFLEADVGISGANFLVAESGTIVLLENEGNIQLTTCLPRRHVVLAGTDKLIESEADLGPLLRLLPISATAQRQTCYVSLFADRHPDMHVVLLDHGRNGLARDVEQRDLLTCIRCGACMNACPVYRNVGGHAYGGAYPGPIGALLLPQLCGLDTYAELPFASSLCGACSEACPVRIPLHRRLLEMRARLTETGQVRTLGASLKVATWVMKQPELLDRLGSLYRFGRGAASRAPAARAWCQGRELPDPRKESFRRWWQRERSGAGRSPRSQADGPERAMGALEPHTGPSRPKEPGSRSATERRTRGSGSAPPGGSAAAAPSLRERFATRFAALGPDGETELHSVPGASEALQWLEDRMAAHPPDQVAIQGEPIDRRGYALGISSAVLLVADTGGVVLDFDERSADRVATLVETHIVVAKSTDLVWDIAEALRVRVERRQLGAWHGMQVFVTGPSRTADVEKILVIPAHGPRRLIVLLCEEPVDLALLRASPSG